MAKHGGNGTNFVRQNMFRKRKWFDEMKYVNYLNNSHNFVFKKEILSNAMRFVPLYHKFTLYFFKIYLMKPKNILMLFLYYNISKKKKKTLIFVVLSQLKTENWLCYIY